MRVARGIAGLPERARGGVLTIGNFDGVHLGHHRILSHLKSRSEHVGGESILLTFDPPPARILGRSAPTPQITTLADRAWLLREAGLDRLVVQPFDLAFAGLSHAYFVEELLEGALAPKELWVGYDFVFGKGRQGDVPYLRAFFEPRGRAVCQVEAVTGVDGAVISSTRVRGLISAGDVAGAARLLGRPHFLRGQVVHGDKRGRTLGFPTANVDPETELLPAKGVYATWLSVGGEVFPGVTNVGERPTVGGGVVRVETHLFDVSLDLYDAEVTVFFVSRLREERAFPDLEALSAQIGRDRDLARARLSADAPPPLAAPSTAPGRPEV